MFVVAGAMHFVTPKSYVAMMPRYLPAHRELVYANGFAEIAGADWVSCTHHPHLGGTLADRDPARCVPRERQHGTQSRRYEVHVPGGRRALLARLPLQALLVAWVRAAGR